MKGKGKIMKFFTNQQMTKKILIIVLVFMMSFTTFQPVVNASVGGKLFEPIVHFLTFISDLGINLLQEFLWDGTNVNDKDNNPYHRVYIRTCYNIFWKYTGIRC